MALEALKRATNYDPVIARAITAIKEALAQPDPYKQGYTDAMNWKVQNHLEHLPTAKPEQEPVAWMHPDGRLWTFGKGFDKSTFTIPLYTTPPQRTWVVLSEQQRNNIEDACEMIIGKPAFDLIDAVLKENNT